MPVKSTKVKVPLPENQKLTYKDLVSFKHEVEERWPQLLQIMHEKDLSGRNRQQPWIKGSNETARVDLDDELTKFYRDMADLLGTDIQQAISVCVFIEDLDQLAILIRSVGKV